MPPASPAWTNPRRWGLPFAGTWPTVEASNFSELVTCSLLHLHLARSRKNWDHKVLALADNTCALSVLQKGRSSVPRMLAVARKVAAITLTLGISVWWGYCMSESNPADGPSRGAGVGVAGGRAAKGFGCLRGP